MIRLLVSVRDVPEALTAAAAGADFIDLKDPAAGALGGLATESIRAIVIALRAAHPRLPISATIGDIDNARIELILQRVAAVAACGVSYVKVGVEPGEAGRALLAALAKCEAAVVPVLLADQGVDLGQVDTALALAAFPALMLDTADKTAGSLTARVASSELADFTQRVQRRGVLAGLAGALRFADLPLLCELAPDFAGFRSAVCIGPRSGALDAGRVRAVRQGLMARLASPA